MAEEAVKKTYFALTYVVAILFGVQIIISGNGEKIQKWMITILRYVGYLLIIRGSQEVIHVTYKTHFQRRKINIIRLLKENNKYFLIFGVTWFLLKYVKECMFTEDFFLLFMAHLITKYPEMDKSKFPIISYGVGMACSFFEGYLAIMIPGDGGSFRGLQRSLRIVESREGIVFPVPRLFIIITKSLYCPPDLADFNKEKRFDIAYLEAIKSAPELKKDVAGCKDRIYRSSVYKINRPGNAAPVFIAAECATPLHTLYKVLEKRGIYQNLCDVNVPEIVEDFCFQLEVIISRSLDCRNKCELIYYDDTDPTVNLADVLLAKVAMIQPEYEQIIAMGPQ